MKVEAIINTEKVDENGDIILNSAFDVGNSEIPVTFGFDKKQPLGKANNIKVSEGVIVAEMELDNSKAENLGDKGRFAIGYIAKETEIDGKTRIIKDLDLIEISLILT